MTHVCLSAFRYAPAIGGAENYGRRLLREIGDRVDVNIVSWLKNQRTDWLRALLYGERPAPETYDVDGRRVTALARWPPATRRKLALLAPGYHVPGSPVPWMMGRAIAPHVRSSIAGAEIVHNVFMGREAFSAAFLIAASEAGLPFVFTPLRHARPLGWNSPAFRRLYAESAAVVALTPGEGEWLVANGARRERVHVIGLGPQNDPNASPDEARRVLETDGRIVLFIGQLHAYKGFGQLVDAARSRAHRKDVLYVFVGPDVRGNARRFEQAGSNVRWLGSVSQSLRDSLLSACTVLCVPSSRESFGSVIVEAWACAKPVIGGPAQATRELIDDGIDGYVVPQDPRVIAERISDVLDDPTRADEMGCKGKEKVEQKYSWDAIAQAHVNIYESLV